MSTDNTTSEPLASRGNCSSLGCERSLGGDAGHHIHEDGQFCDECCPHCNTDEAEEPAGLVARAREVLSG